MNKLISKVLFKVMEWFTDKNFQGSRMKQLRPVRLNVLLSREEREKIIEKPLPFLKMKVNILTKCPEINAIIEMHSTRIIKKTGKLSEQTRYFISSSKKNAEEFLKLFVAT